MTSNIINNNLDVLLEIRTKIRRLRTEACILDNFMKGINETIVDELDYEYFKELDFPIKKDVLFGCSVKYESTESKG